MQFSHHSSNPLEVHTSDVRNAAYHRQLAANGQDESSDELGRWSDKDNYQSQVLRVVPGLGRTLGNLDIPPFKGNSATPVAGPSRVPFRKLVQEYVDLDEAMESDDELAIPYEEDIVRTPGRKKLEVIKDVYTLFDDEIDTTMDEFGHPRQPQNGTLPEEEVGDITATYEEQEEIIMIYEDEQDIVVVQQDEEEQLDEQHMVVEDNEERTYVEDDWDQVQVNGFTYADEDDMREESMSPLTPLSDAEESQQPSVYSSPQSSRPPSPDESRTLLARPIDEQDEILTEITELYKSVPVLEDNYELVDRLGTGTFSSVYKAIDLKYNTYDNHAWQGTHPPNSSAYYQRAGPSYRGRGGRRTTRDDMDDQTDNNHEGLFEGRVYVAIKRIYTTSGPERIRNEVSIMEDCRGTRHTSQIITAFRERDQVVIVLPYQRNMDFRDFFQILHPEGIKCYFRCLFRALNDIHKRGIIHRDVKPANFLYDPFTGIGTLCDFGLASRMESGSHLGACLHQPWSSKFPHGQNLSHTDKEIDAIKARQLQARNNCRMAPEKVGYPENDRRPISKANRAGTRGFRAPEVLLKCGAQTGAIDVWSVGVIMLFFLTGKFPIFQSNDDVEGLMEIAVIIGLSKLEKTATLHGRIISTNIPSLDMKGITWQTFVERLNPDIYKPKKYDMRFYPHNCKHRDGPSSSSKAAQSDPHAPETLADAIASAIASVAAENDDGEGPPTPPLPPSTTTPTSTTTTTDTETSTLTTTSATDRAVSGPSERYANPRSAERHARDMKQVFALLELILHAESTKRATPERALGLPFLEEPAVGADAQFAPLRPGEGVCRRLHHHDEEREVDQVILYRECACRRAESESAEGGKDKAVEQHQRGQALQLEKLRQPREGGTASDSVGAAKRPLNAAPEKVLDVFDDAYNPEEDDNDKAGRGGHGKYCNPIYYKDLVAGEGISFGREACEFHQGERYREELVYDD